MLEARANMQVEARAEPDADEQNDGQTARESTFSGGRVAVAFAENGLGPALRSSSDPRRSEAAAARDVQRPSRREAFCPRIREVLARSHHD